LGGMHLPCKPAVPDDASSSRTKFTDLPHQQSLELDCREAP
jgi:hypothetical protein